RIRSKNGEQRRSKASNSSPPPPIRRIPHRRRHLTLPIRGSHRRPDPARLLQQHSHLQTAGQLLPRPNPRPQPHPPRRSGAESGRDSASGGSRFGEIEYESEARRSARGSDSAEGRNSDEGSDEHDATQSEWYHVRSFQIPNGWSPRGGQAVNPYVEGGDPCGSSSGSAISVAANMVAVSLGTETDGSILCPADYNSVVGIKPTVSLTSRAGVIPVSPRQDTIGFTDSIYCRPICRTVSDAVYVLDAIVGFDPRDCEATNEAAKFIPSGGYKQFLKKDGLKGKKIGIVAVNRYLEDLVESPVRSLAEIVAFNVDNSKLERMEEFGQELLVAAEMTNGIGKNETEAIRLMDELSREGFEAVMKQHELDAMVTIGSDVSSVLAIGGYPAISVPAGYDEQGKPFGIVFGGLKGTESSLIEASYAFEQATKARQAPVEFSLHLNRKISRYAL
ncbi:Probable amidase At4g34880, partial [Linum perenne]